MHGVTLTHQFLTDINIRVVDDVEQLDTGHRGIAALGTRALPEGIIGDFRG